jgi:hypothetical protein
MIPAYGNLGNFSDSIFSASKRVAQTSLDNIRPPNGPDETYLREVKSTETLKTNFLHFTTLMADLFSQYETLLHFPPPNTPTEAYGALTVLKFLNNAIRKATVFLKINIKPYVSGLDGKELHMLDELHDDLKDYRTATGAIIAHFAGINAADNSFAFLETNVEELLEQMAISINMYNQNEAGFSTPSTLPQTISMSGGGRNFYGEKLNDNPDVPTLYSDYVKNCPTRYLL